MSDTNIMICCPKCNGAGIVMLPTALRETLEVLSETEGMTAMQVLCALRRAGKTADIYTTAINNRLTSLFEFELVTREGETWSRTRPYQWKKIASK